jgi:hypothetical protein
MPDRHLGPPGRRWSIKRLFRGFRLAWAALVAGFALSVATDPPQPPEPTPPLAKGAALREGALLFKYVDARSTKHVA